MANEAIETACGLAVIVVVSYVILFADFSGNGRLIDSARGAVQEALGVTPDPGPVPVRARIVPVRPEDEREMYNRMLAVPDVGDKDIRVSVVAADQPRPLEPVAEVSTGGAAGPGKDWRKHLSTRLRSVTVYGRGEQAGFTSAAGFSGNRGGISNAAVSVPTPAAADSAFSRGAAAPAQARPGVSDHVVRAGAPADGVRNFR